MNFFLSFLYLLSIFTLSIAQTTSGPCTAATCTPSPTVYVQNGQNVTFVTSWSMSWSQTPLITGSIMNSADLFSSLSQGAASAVATDSAASSIAANFGTGRAATSGTKRIDLDLKKIAITTVGVLFGVAGGMALL